MISSVSEKRKNKDTSTIPTYNRKTMKAMNERNPLISWIRMQIWLEHHRGFLVTIANYTTEYKVLTQLCVLAQATEWIVSRKELCGDVHDEDLFRL